MGLALGSAVEPAALRELLVPDVFHFVYFLRKVRIALAEITPAASIVLR